MKQFSVGEAVKFGWNTMKNNLGFFIGMLILGTIIIVVPHAIFAQYYNYIHEQIQTQVTQVGGPSWLQMAIEALLLVIYIVLTLMIQLGYVRIALSFVDKGKGKFSELFSVFPRIFTYLIASIFYAIIVAVGLMLFIFPGVIWALRYSLYSYHILDNHAGPIEALKMSARTTMGAKWDLFALAVVGQFLVALGLLAFGIGLFATVPTVMVSWAFVYRHLAK